MVTICLLRDIFLKMQLDDMKVHICCRILSGSVQNLFKLVKLKVTDVASKYKVTLFEENG